MTASARHSAPQDELPRFLRERGAPDQTAKSRFRLKLPQVRLLPAVMAAAMLLLGMKTLNIAAGASDLLANRAASADVQHLPAVAPAGGTAAPAAVEPPQYGDAAEADGATAPASLAEDDPGAPAGADFMSRSELNLLQDLAARRQELVARSEELDTRERLLLATEQRIDRKIERLKSIESQINGLLRTHSEQQEAQIAGLVRVYETMKPKDAAAILEKLDMDVLIPVIQRMNSRKLALVMAQMSPDMAKKVTVELTTRKQLPTIEG